MYVYYEHRPDYVNLLILHSLLSEPQQGTFSDPTAPLKPKPLEWATCRLLSP